MSDRLPQKVEFTLQAKNKAAKEIVGQKLTTQKDGNTVKLGKVIKAEIGREGFLVIIVRMSRDWPEICAKKGQHLRMNWSLQ